MHQTAKHAPTTLSALLALASLASAQDSPFGTGAPAVPDRLLIKFADPTRASVAAWVDEMKAAPVAASLVPGLYQVDFTPTGLQTFVDQGQATLRDEIEYLHPDYYLLSQAGPPTDADFDKQWALEAVPVAMSGSSGPFTPLAIADIEALDAWTIFPGKGKETVAVVDSGINVSSHEFENTLWTSNGQVGFDFVLNAGVQFDSDLKGHGTSVAAIIGARSESGAPDDIVGVSPGCKIMPLRAFQATTVNGNTLTAAPTSRIIKALGFAEQQGVRITNNSYGAVQISDAKGLKDAIDALRIAGVLFVCSAGNGKLDIDIDPFFPASFDLDNMIVVTSTDPSDQIPSKRNVGKKTVDLAAPGEEIYAPADIWGGYGRVGGTSFATAHVSGAAALVWEYVPQWDYAEVKACIRDSVRQAPQFAGLVSTGGVLHLEQLMLCAQKAQMQQDR